MIKNYNNLIIILAIFVFTAGSVSAAICGASHMGAFSSPPVTDLCDTGTAISFLTNETTYTWTCKDWVSSGPLDQWSAIAISSTGQYQTATTNMGKIYCSSNYGVAWTLRKDAYSQTSPDNFYDIAISSTGQYQTAVGSTLFYVSSDYGVTWTLKNNSSIWTGVGMSSTGQYQVALACAQAVSYSNDYGVTWVDNPAPPMPPPTGSCGDIAVSSDGSKMTIVTEQGVSTSSNYGASWTYRGYNLNTWIDVKMSSTGQYQIGVVANNTFYTSTNYGVVWTAGPAFAGVEGVSISSNGQYQAAVGATTMFTSSNYGASWTTKDFSSSMGGSDVIIDVAISSNGQYQTWVSEDLTPQQLYEGLIYTSNNYFGGEDDACFADRILLGTCGTADGYSYSSTDEINTSFERCQSGTFTSFTDNGSSWGWSCDTSWTTKASMITNTSAGVVSFKAETVNGRIYVMGGRYGATNKNMEYDPATNTWATKANLPTARVYFGMAQAYDKIYVIGGYYDFTSYSFNEEYDPATNTWLTKTAMPTARHGLVAASVNNKIYAIGGTSSKNEEYDPNTNAWITKTAPTYNRQDATVAVVDSKIYVIGGNLTPNTYNHLEYNPADDTWTLKAPLVIIADNHTIQGAGAGVLDGKIYVIGGVSNALGLIVPSAVNKYDPVANTWEIKTSMPTPRHNLAVTALNNKIYAIAGRGMYEHVPGLWTMGELGVNEEYNPLNDVPVSCSATKVICSSSSEQTLRDQPSSLCQYGTASPNPPILTDNVWNWNCTDNPGVDATCYTNKTSCGSSSGGTFSEPPSTNLCLYGSASSVTTNPTTYDWTCTGDDSLAVSCSATIESGAPSATNLKNPLEIDNSSNGSCWYCTQYLSDGSLVSGRSGSLDFKFTYTDTDPTAHITGYQFAIGTDPSVANALITTSLVSISPQPIDTEITYQGISVMKTLNVDLKQIPYGQTYHWWVKVYNDKSKSSDWIEDTSIFATAAKAFPIVRIVPKSTDVSMGSSTVLCVSADINNPDDTCYATCWKGQGTPSLSSSDWKCSICFDASNNRVPCSTTNGNTFAWSLISGSGYLSNSSVANPTLTVIFAGTDLVARLKITGSDCDGEGEVTARMPLPRWREIKVY